MSHALPLYRADAVRALERAAAARGIDATTLMARAGASVAALAMARWPGARRIGVLCGRGNNGGDGYVAALALHHAGLDVRVLSAGEPMTPEAKDAARAWREAGQGVQAIDAPHVDAESCSPALPCVDLWIDALFGVGLNRAPEAALAAVLYAIGASGAPVLAVDVPSGLDADAGSAPGVALRADLTLCLVGAKRGLFTAAGRALAGEVRIDALDVPQETFAAASPAAFAVAAPALRAALPQRGDDSHKGRHGRVLCVGGDAGMQGALVLCAEAAARGGAGSVVAWTRPGAVAALNARRPEVMATAVDARLASGDDDAALRDALDATAADVIAIGPGLGRGAWGRALFDAALASGRPLVIDADALGLLAERHRDAGQDEPWPRMAGDAVLTPHPGEAARLLGVSTADVQRDRFAALDALVARYRCTVVLKGAGTLVGAPGETPRVVRAGNPGMATAGMGDVLAGVIAALRAQGLSAYEAAWVGALAHSAAGDVAAGSRPRGLLAGDVLEALREALNP